MAGAVTIARNTIVPDYPAQPSGHQIRIPSGFRARDYGTYGSRSPALMRHGYCGWFGVRPGLVAALNTLFAAIIRVGKPCSAAIGGHLTTNGFRFCSLGLNIFIYRHGSFAAVEIGRAVRTVATAVLGLGNLEAHGLGYLLTQQSKFHTIGEFWAIFIPSLTAMIGFWATLSLNMPDFTRFGKSQRDQVIGQVAALPTTMTVFAAMGVVITSAAVVIHPHMKPDELWDPMKLVSQFSQVFVIAISMFTVVVATLAVNIAANVVSPANDFANAFPKWISFRTGGLITRIVGI